ncbi:MAG TPA: hypothetical protein VIG08_17760 [Gemmatimonadales bacterium]|jgi:hypothetical protein
MPNRYYLLILACLACGAPAPALRSPVRVAPWLRADPQRCLLMRDLREGMEMMAKRCAEQFVRQNGYTDEPPTTDSTRWVYESGEDGPWPMVLDSRLGSLEPSAISVQCSQRQCLVFFRLRRPVLSCAYRTVAMTQVFTRIRLVPGALQDTRCGQRRA